MFGAVPVISSIMHAYLNMMWVTTTCIGVATDMNYLLDSSHIFIMSPPLTQPPKMAASSVISVKLC